MIKRTLISNILVQEKFEFNRPKSDNCLSIYNFLLIDKYIFDIGKCLDGQHTNTKVKAKVFLNDFFSPICKSLSSDIKFHLFKKTFL